MMRQVCVSARTTYVSRASVTLQGMQPESLFCDARVALRFLCCLADKT